MDKYLHRLFARLTIEWIIFTMLQNTAIQLSRSQWTMFTPIHLRILYVFRFSDKYNFWYSNNDSNNNNNRSHNHYQYLSPASNPPPQCRWAREQHALKSIHFMSPEFFASVFSAIRCKQTTKKGVNTRIVLMGIHCNYVCIHVRHEEAQQKKQALKINARRSKGISNFRALWPVFFVSFRELDKHDNRFVCIVAPHN